MLFNLGHLSKVSGKKVVDRSRCSQLELNTRVSWLHRRIYLKWEYRVLSFFQIYCNIQHLIIFPNPLQHSNTLVWFILFLCTKLVWFIHAYVSNIEKETYVSWFPVRGNPYRERKFINVIFSALF